MGIKTPPEAAFQVVPRPPAFIDENSVTEYISSDNEAPPDDNATGAESKPQILENNGQPSEVHDKSAAHMAELPTNEQKTVIIDLGDPLSGERLIGDSPARPIYIPERLGISPTRLKTKPWKDAQGKLRIVFDLEDSEEEEDDLTENSVEGTSSSTM